MKETAEFPVLLMVADICAWLSCRRERVECLRPEDLPML